MHLPLKGLLINNAKTCGMNAPGEGNIKIENDEMCMERETSRLKMMRLKCGQIQAPWFLHHDKERATRLGWQEEP